jgi:glycosyltransferase involved in cell wall biosynthesis
VVIVGDGPLRARLREQASSLKNVFFAGPLSDEELLQHFAVADVFVLPSTSRAESFGIAALEAQSMGVPAVITDVGTGTVEAIDPGKSGLVVAPKDARALTRAISEILDDDERRLSMKAHARENVLARHSMIAAAPRLRALYEKVAGSASRPH